MDCHVFDTMLFMLIVLIHKAKINVMIVLILLCKYFVYSDITKALLALAAGLPEVDFSKFLVSISIK